MAHQTQKLVSEVEDIKMRLIALETAILGTEKASDDDMSSLKEALEEYRKRKTVRFKN